MGLKLGHSAFSRDLSTNRYVGVEVQPTITTDDVNNTITVNNDGEYYVFTEAEHRGNFLRVVPDNTTIDIDEDGTTFYVFVEYINGQPIINKSVNIRKLADGNVAPIARVVRTNGIFHIFKYTRLALGLPEKINSFLEFSFAFTLIGGLGVQVNGQDISIGPGEVTLGVSITQLPETNSVDADTSLFQILRVDNDYDWGIINELNNTDYQGPNSLIEMDAGFFNVQWVWRGVEDDKHVYTVLNEEQYETLSDAQNAPRPLAPKWVTDHSIPLARIIYEKNGTEPTEVSQVEQGEFDTVEAVRHNDLPGLQGGTGNEHFHLTANQHNKLTNHVGEGGVDQHPLVDYVNAGFMSSDMLVDLETADSQSRENYVLVKEESDLPDAVNGVRQLADNTLYEFNGQVTTTDSLQYGEDSKIIGRHWFTDSLVYTGIDDAIIVNNANFYMEGMTVSSPNGRAFNAFSNEMHELLFSFCAFVNCDQIGRTEGFRSPGFININSLDYGEGFVFEGAMDQIFLTECPFRLGRDNSRAIILGESLNSEFVSITTSFFKDGGVNAVGIEKHENASVNKLGLVRGCTFDDSVVPTEGFDHTTIEWDFQGNDGVPNSTITGKMFYSPIIGSPVETNITTQNQWVKMNIPTQGNQQERINVTTSNRLVYEGVRQARLQIITNWTGTPNSNNTQYQFAIAINGTVDNSTVVPVFMRSTTQPQPVPISTILTLNQDDYIEVFVRNVDGTANISTHSIQVSIIR